MVCQVLDEVNESHVAMVGIAHKLFHPAEKGRKKGERGAGGRREREREREEGGAGGRREEGGEEEEKTMGEGTNEKRGIGEGGREERE